LNIFAHLLSLPLKKLISVINTVCSFLDILDHQLFLTFKQTVPHLFHYFSKEISFINRE
jgi:hypothetical protein